MCDRTKSPLESWKPRTVFGFSVGDASWYDDGLCAMDDGWRLAPFSAHSFSAHLRRSGSGVRYRRRAHGIGARHLRQGGRADGGGWGVGNTWLVPSAGRVLEGDIIEIGGGKCD